MKVDLGYCMGKRKYHKRDAQTAMNFRERNGAEKLRIYQCNFCDFWHLTHKEYNKSLEK